MKTNKLWSIVMMLVLVLGTAITFSSCSKDDEGGTDTGLVGTWVMNAQDYHDILNVEITFKSNGTGSVQAFLNGTHLPNDDASFTWTSEGDILTMHMNEQVEGEYVYYPSGTMTMKYTISGNVLTIISNDGETVVYKRK